MFDDKWLSALAGVIIAITGLIATVVTAYIRLTNRDNVTDSRIDQIWDRNLARGKAKSVRRGLIKEFGVQHIRHETSEDVQAAYAPIASGLRKLYDKNRSLTDGQITEIIAREYGPWLFRHICEVLDVFDDECLAIALVVAKSPNPPKSDSGPHKTIQEVTV